MRYTVSYGGKIINLEWKNYVLIGKKYGIIYLIARSLTKRVHAKHLIYGMPEWVYLIARSLTKRAHAEHLTYGMPEWVWYLCAYGQIYISVRGDKKCSYWDFPKPRYRNVDGYGRVWRRIYSRSVTPNEMEVLHEKEKGNDSGFARECHIGCEGVCCIAAWCWQWDLEQMESREKNVGEVRTAVA